MLNMMLLLFSRIVTAAAIFSYDPAPSVYSNYSSTSNQSNFGMNLDAALSTESVKTSTLR